MARSAKRRFEEACFAASTGTCSELEVLLVQFVKAVRASPVNRYYELADFSGESAQFERRLHGPDLRCRRLVLTSDGLTVKNGEMPSSDPEWKWTVQGSVDLADPNFESKVVALLRWAKVEISDSWLADDC